MTDGDDTAAETEDTFNSPNSSLSAGPPPRLIFDEDARNIVDKHVSADTTQERGGVLVGTMDQTTGTLEITAAIPATLAKGSPASLTFTHEAWDEVESARSEHYPDTCIVGWYHSHPGFGIFLSEYDTFIQRNFFSAPGQVAYVVDPLLGECGFFAQQYSEIFRYDEWILRPRAT
jgi:proteasome lid subunit RPN8/RPN11